MQLVRVLLVHGKGCIGLAVFVMAQVVGHARSRAVGGGDKAQQVAAGWNQCKRGTDQGACGREGAWG
jgi:hypothetical protein